VIAIIEDMPPTPLWPIETPLRTVFLDRDGVINEKMPEGRYVQSEDDLRIVLGAPQAIGKLNRAGIRVLVVSNQRGIALGLYTPEDVHAIHAILQAQLRAQGACIDAFYFCPHDKGACECRKPMPGLYEQATAQFPDIDAETSVMIGDSLSDVEFGNRLKMRTIWIGGDPETRKPGSEMAEHCATWSCSSLVEAVDLLLRLSLAEDRI
jgi:D-glycero-D-manno-heptose 1,7-bisphosphate phosphatase